jgi:acetoin utilization deacetylase AcuC-like enzyme
VQGTVEAARDALATGAGINLAGGTHHAVAERGEGFCVFNDVAVAARVLQRNYPFHREQSRLDVELPDATDDGGYLAVDGLRARDRRVFGACARRALAVVLTLAGGYAERMADIVAIHTNIVEELRAAFG